jgi:putative spermidine/putrescine transport system permease protein
MEANMRKKWTVETTWVLVLVLFMTPVLFLFFRSMTSGWNWENFSFVRVDWSGWLGLVTDPIMLKAIFTSMGINLIVIIFNFIISLPAAKVLAHHSFKGKAYLETFLSLPILFPSLAMVMGIHITMIKLGLTDNWLGVSLVHLIPTVPYSIRILRAGFDNVGPHLESQARTLGGSKRNILYHIYLPLLFPSIRSVIFLVTVISLSQYALTAIIGGGNVITLAMMYFPYFSTVNETMIASFSILFAFIPIVILVLLEILFRLLVPYRKKAKIVGELFDR